MQLNYVVLYVTDPEACLEFWTAKVGMVARTASRLAISTS